MDIGIGPLRLRMYSGEGWRSLELAVSTPLKDCPRQETAIRASLRADHLRNAVKGAPTPTPAP
jgi:hypothetical protein